MTNRPLARHPYSDQRRPRNPFHRPVGPDPAAGTGSSWYRIALAPSAAPVAAPDEDEDGEVGAAADIYLYDAIGGWFGTYAEDLVKDVAGLDVDVLRVHLNSPGGDVAEGTAIANVLRQHRARVIVHVDGLAASAASIVAMAGDEVVMGLGAQLMIHDASTIVFGNVAELDAAARMLDSASDAMAATYAAKAGGTAAQWREVMRAETWYTAEEAVTAGLADRVATTKDNGSAGGDPIRPGHTSTGGGWWDMWDSLGDPDRFDLTAYRYAGRPAAPPPVMPGRPTPAAAAAGTTTNRKGAAVAELSDDQLTTLRTKLGLADDADVDTIVDATVEALDEQAEDPPTQIDPAAPAAASAALQLPAGIVAVEAGQLEQLRRDAAAGAEARARQVREDRERIVDAAIGDGRIAPARRQHWLDALTADQTGAAATLAALQPGLVPVGTALGHDVPAAERPDDGWFPQYAGPAGTTAKD